MFKSSWTELINASKVNDQPPATTDHFRALIAALEVDLLREGLCRRWDHQLEGLDAPPLGKRPEKKAAELAARIAAALRWHDETWSHLVEAFAKTGLAWPRVLEQVP